MVLTKGRANIPYSADITTEFKDGGPKDTRRISGIWKNVRAVNIYAIIPEGVELKSAVGYGKQKIGIVMEGDMNNGN
jgi:hypothetical protein